MTRKHILIPLTPESGDLKALFHALALSERIKSKLFVLLMNRPEARETRKVLETVARDVVNGACEEGRQVSFHLATDDDASELLQIIASEDIDLIAVNDSDIRLKNVLRGIRHQIPSQIVTVCQNNSH